MRRRIGLMIRSLVLVAAVLGSHGAKLVFGGEGISVTVGVTPSCPYGLAG